MIDKQQQPSNLPKRFRTFNTMSLKPAIGYQYIAYARKWHKKNDAWFVQDRHWRLDMPRYYKEKIFTKLDRQIHAIETQERIQQQEQEKLVELAQYTNDPIGYMRERLEQKEKKINSKLTSTTL